MAHCEIDNAMAFTKAELATAQTAVGRLTDELARATATIATEAAEVARLRDERDRLRGELAALRLADPMLAMRDMELTVQRLRADLATATTTIARLRDEIAAHINNALHISADAHDEAMKSKVMQDELLRLRTPRECQGCGRVSHGVVWCDECHEMELRGRTP